MENGKCETFAQAMENSETTAAKVNRCVLPRRGAVLVARGKYRVFVRFRLCRKQTTEQKTLRMDALPRRWPRGGKNPNIPKLNTELSELEGESVCKAGKNSTIYVSLLAPDSMNKKNAHLKTGWAQNQSADIGLELEIVAGPST